MNRDLVSQLGAIVSIVPGGDGAGSGADLRDFDSAAVLLSADAAAVADPVKLEESDDAETWSDVAAEDILGDPLAVVQSGTTMVGYRGSKRYLRANVTTSAGNVSAVILGGNAHGQPAKNPDSAA